MKEIIMDSKRCRKKYFIYGFLFGVVFPIIAFLIRYLQFGFDETINLLISDPLLWIISSAPLFLGSFAYFAGVKQDEVNFKMKILNKSEDQLRESNDKLNSVFEKLQKEHDELVEYQKQNNDFEKLEFAMKEFKFIIDELGKFNLTVELNSSDSSTCVKSSDLADSLSTTINNLRKVILKELDLVNLTASSSQQIVHATNIIDENLTDQNRNAGDIFADVNELVKLIEENSIRSENVASESFEVGNKVNELENIFEETKENVNEIVDSVSTSKDIIEKLYRSSEEIENVIKVIGDLAEQTNLLSLNAGIEAARAGEHGRGFAVVAEEVSKLADRTKGATTEINKIIQKIREDIESTVVTNAKGVEKANNGKISIENANKHLLNIVEKIQIVLKTNSSLSEDNKNQLVLSRDIESRMENILDMLNGNKTNISEIIETINSLANNILDSEKLLNQFKLQNNKAREKAKRKNNTNILIAK